MILNSKKEIIKPFFLFSILIFIASLILSFYLSPYSYETYKKDEFDLRTNLDIKNIGLNNFYDFNIIKVGDYHPDDSDWNYKDVTQVEKMHDSIDSRINTAVSSDFQLGIDTLVLFGFKFPVSLVQYEYAKYNIFY